MRVTVKLFATLKDYAPGGRMAGTPFEVDLPDASTIEDLFQHIGVPSELVKTAFVNARQRPNEWELKPGDEIGIFPPVGGG